MSRFVRPDTATLTISAGDTLTVRKRLNAGERRAMFASMYIAGADGSMRANPLRWGSSVVLAYLLDWSLTDDNGQKVQIAGLSAEMLHSVLDSLDPESYEEIIRAVDTHAAAMGAEREIEKKDLVGATPL